MDFSTVTIITILVASVIVFILAYAGIFPSSWRKPIMGISAAFFTLGLLPLIRSILHKSEKKHSEPLPPIEETEDTKLSPEKIKEIENKFQELDLRSDGSDFEIGKIDEKLEEIDRPDTYDNSNLSDDELNSEFGARIKRL